MRARPALGPGGQWHARLVNDTRRFGAAQVIAVTWILIVVALLLLGWLLTHSWGSGIDSWDNDVERWIAARRTSDLDRVASAGTFIANTWFGLGEAAVVAIAVSVWQRSFLPAIFFAVLVAGGLGMYLVSTQLISRDRPPVPILDPGLVPDHSFPSGHVITAVVVYGGTALLLAHAAPHTSRWVSPLLLLPLIVAPARLYQGAHHPSDVLTSLVFATAWVVVVTRMLLPRPEQHAPEATPSGHSRLRR